jgi:hypothetical protein
MTITTFLYVLTPALSALTVLAYKHPEAYEKMLGPLAFVVAVQLVAGLAWQAGIGTLRDSLMSCCIDHAHQSAAKAAADGLTLGRESAIVWYSGSIFVWFYLCFLSALPLLIRPSRRP